MQPALGFLSIDSLKFLKWVCKTLKLKSISQRVTQTATHLDHGLSLVYTVQEESSWTLQKGMMYMKPTPFPKLTSERGRQKYLLISPLWIPIRVLGSHLARSPSLVKKPLGSVPLICKWHSVLKKTYLEVKHSASTLKYCYFWEKEKARGRDKDRKKGTYLGGTRLTVLETKCLRRKMNVRSNKAEDCHDNAAQLISVQQQVNMPGTVTRK